MKIAFIVGVFPTLSETFILNQITGLIDLGHDIEIFTYRCNFNEEIHPDIFKYNLKNKVYDFNIPSKRIIRIIKAGYLIITNFSRSPVKIIKSLNIFKYGKAALSLNLFYVVISFLDKNYDIIYCHFGSIGNLAVCLKQIGIKGKIVTMFHGADIRLGIIKGKNYYKKLFEFSDCILAISKYNYKNLIRFGANPKKIIFHPVGIDTNKFNNYSSRKPKKIVILTVARLVEEKGLSYGLKSIKLLLDKNPRLRIKYKIIGDGPLEKCLKQIVKDLNLNNVVNFLGAGDQKSVIRQMEMSSIFLLPSIAEALPVVLMEAQAMRLPVITTDVGGISEVIINNKSGFIVPARDIKAMAEKLKYLIDHQKIWSQMGECGRKFVEERYDINKLNLRLISIFQNVLGN